MGMGAPALAEDSTSSRIIVGLVLEDQNKAKKYRDLDTQAMNAATAAFLSTRRFDVVERKELSKIFEEKSLKDILGDGSNSLFDLLGLDMIGFVSYTVEYPAKKSPLFTLTVRLAAVSTGEILGTFESVRLTAITSSSIAIAGDQLSANLRGAFPPEGSIVRVNDKKTVVVDMGTALGLKSGDTLVMIQDGEPIIHWESGDVLPGEEILVGKLKVENVSLQTATCKVKSAAIPVEVSLRVRYQTKTKRFDRYVPKSFQRLLRRRVSKESAKEL